MFQSNRVIWKKTHFYISPRDTHFSLIVNAYNAPDRRIHYNIVNGKNKRQKKRRDLKIKTYTSRSIFGN